MRALILNWGIRLGQKQVEQKGMDDGIMFGWKFIQ
jgi:hypothetical protein